MKDMLLKLWVKAQILREDDGQDLIEYALLAALIALVIATTIPTVTTAITGVWTDIASALG